MKELDKSKCPEFDYFDYEHILEWAGAKVVWEDTFTNLRTGKVTHDPKRALWTLLWGYGFIGFDTICKKEDEAKARMAAAMFIYLWCKGVQASEADALASLYARHVVKSRC